MPGLMQHWPLTLDRFLEHARRWHGEREVVSRSNEGLVTRCGYTDIHRRAKQLSQALLEHGIGHEDRVATLAFNSARHLEAWYGILGIGAVCHTLNPRLPIDQLVFIVNHACDRVILADALCVPILQQLLPRCASVERVVLFADEEQMPGGFEATAYESWIAGRDTGCRWGGFAEDTAAGLCYTSGTTGDPKGVLYSHRSNFLHGFATLMPDAFGLSGRDVVLAIVPMFHANAWGLAFAAPAAGAKFVLPGAKLDGASVFELMEAERVTFAAGVPTVWQGLLQHLEREGARPTTLKRIVSGGAAMPEALMRIYQERYGIEVRHAWGMTEMSPLGTVCSFKAQHAALSQDERYAVMSKQGRAIYGVDMKVVDPQGAEIPFGSESSGDLHVRGPWILARYFKDEGGDPLVDGWFPTGDVAKIDADGYMQITDRSKDVIKSGGEWIGSIDLENIAMAHPAVAMAACIAARHPKWDERPLLVVMKKPGAELTRDDLIAFFEGKIAKWWTPDDVVFVDAIPLGATGKMQKNKLREQFKDHQLPTA
ncbi:MAG: long-chain-fatty-acid--CoA ligase [Rubrivivax sp.]|nr:long-chain-fatty-acid--CoA ligase [Rubrivivax sp.]